MPHKRNYYNYYLIFGNTNTKKQYYQLQKISTTTIPQTTTNGSEPRCRYSCQDIFVKVLTVCSGLLLV